MNARGHKRAAAAIERAQRMDRAVELKKVGLSYQQIADQLGISKGAAWNLVDDALKELADRREGKTAEMRELINERLEGMMFRFWQKASNGDVAAAKVILDILAKQSRLYGADAPAKVAPTSPDGATPYQPEENTRWVYFLPQPAATEEEWLKQQQHSSQPQASD